MATSRTADLSGFQLPNRWWPPAADYDYFALLQQCVAVGTPQYGNLLDLILVQNDRIEGVQSYIAKDTALYPTGYALVRDARQTTPAQLRSPDNPLTESNNMLLRVLSAMRAIDFVLAKIGRTDLQAQLNYAVRRLLVEIERFQKQAGTGEALPGKISEYEVDFNATLKGIVQKAGLADEMQTDKDFAMLLGHYRNLASTLDPAKSMVTVQQYSNDYTHVEIAHPITGKTREQRAQLAVMHTFSAAETETEKNFHNTKKRAMRMANAYFYEQIVRDDTRLPAQMRRTIGPTIKNGYITCSQLWKSGSILVGEQWSARSSSPVYVGGGETEEKLSAYAKESMRQIREHIHQLRYKNRGPIESEVIHVLSLLTDSTLENQDLMIRWTKMALMALNKEFASETQPQLSPIFYLSNIPTNLLGLAYSSEISELVGGLAETIDSVPSAGRDIGRRAERAKKAAEIIRIVNRASNITNAVSCASGLDRTGTIIEIAEEQWLQKMLSEQWVDLPLEIIQRIRACACHNAILASLAAPGSPGMKPCSMPGDFFPAEVAARFYRDSADSNKASPILRQTAKQALQRALNEAEEILQDTQASNPLSAIVDWVEKALQYQQSKEKTSLPARTIQQVGRLFGKGGEAVSRETVNDILKLFQMRLEDAGNDDLPRIIEITRDEIMMAKHMTFAASTRRMAIKQPATAAQEARAGGTVLDQFERLLTMLEKCPRFVTASTAAAAAPSAVVRRSSSS